MRIKLDENIPYSLITDLNNLGHDVDTVINEGLQGKKDPDVWKAAQLSERFFITQDLDFSDIRLFKPGTHCGILLLRLQHPGRMHLINRICTMFINEPVEQWKRCFVIATDTKIRIAKP